MKKILYVLLGIAVLYFILALFGPSEIKIEREIVISRPKNMVKHYMSDFKFFHSYWSPWTPKDTAMICVYKGNAGEIGHSYSWSGNKEVGKGEMELTSISADSICMRLSFDGEGDSKIYYILKEENGGTKVIWGLIMQIGFFGRTPMLFLNMDKMMGVDFEKGLNNLKVALENTEVTAETQYNIKENNWEEVSYIGRKETVDFANLDKFFEDNFGMLTLVLEKNKIEMKSAASGLFFSYDEVNQRTDVSTAYRVPKGTRIKGWELFTFPACRVACVEFKGDPAKSGEAHGAIATYLKEKGLDYSMVIEEYVFSPIKSEDLNSSITNIYYLLK